jgi:hypothetical protein
MRFAALLLLLLGGCTMTEPTRYEMWRLRGPDGKDSFHILPAGRLAPEIQKLGERVPMSQAMEDVFVQAVKESAKGK